MDDAPTGYLQWRPHTAILVMECGCGLMLCPFFGKCDGVLFIDSAAKYREFRPNATRTAVALCDMLLAHRPRRLICGFVGWSEKARLRAAGIDVRLGSCLSPIDHLQSCFEDLPPA